jgi:hypothetical protein
MRRSRHDSSKARRSAKYVSYHLRCYERQRCHGRSDVSNACRCSAVPLGDRHGLDPPSLAGSSRTRGTVKPEDDSERTEPEPWALRSAWLIIIGGAILSAIILVLTLFVLPGPWGSDRLDGNDAKVEKVKAENSVRDLGLKTAAGIWRDHGRARGLGSSGTVTQGSKTSGCRRP